MKTNEAFKHYITKDPEMVFVSEVKRSRSVDETLDLGEWLYNNKFPTAVQFRSSLDLSEQMLRRMPGAFDISKVAICILNARSVLRRNGSEENRCVVFRFPDRTGQGSGSGFEVQFAYDLPKLNMYYQHAISGLINMGYRSLGAVKASEYELEIDGVTYTTRSILRNK